MGVHLFINYFSFLISFFVFSNAHAALPVIERLHLVPSKASVMAPTPDFSSRQVYLEDAPKGVGARSVWALAGGKGENTKIIDVEVGYNSDHEDLLKFIFDSGNFKSIDSNHGSAVLGVIVGSDNGVGVKGISYKSEMGFSGFAEGALDVVDQSYIDGINKAIRDAAAQLSEGDVLVIEQHMFGPDNNNYTAVEYWDPIFAELKKVTEKGIHCVEAAGNGGSNFDSPAYKGAFDLKLRDSGCILVGAGSMTTKERLYFSNYGSRIDAFGFGGGVATIGYGDLFNGGANRYYTGNFSGTSSATPIVAGAVAVVNSIAEAQGIKVTPQQMREALRATGTPQGPTTKNENIGNLPDIFSILKYLKLKTN